MLSGNLVTLADAATRRRLRAVMTRIGENVRTGALTRNLFLQAVRTTGYDWDAVSPETRKDILIYIEGGIQHDSSFWTRASHLAGGGRANRQTIINDLMTEWGDPNGIAPSLYGRDFEEARVRLRAHLES